MANPFDYKFIEPLTSTADVRGSAVFCRFVCPVTGRSVSASEEIRNDPPPPIQEQPQAGILGNLRRSLAAALQGVLGTPEHAEAMAEAIPDNDVDPDEAARRRAVVRAFRAVSSLFRWESAAERWVAVDAGKDTLTAFERRLRVHPLRGTPDLDLLLRMLVAVARADGGIDDEETAFLQVFAAASDAPLADILEQPAPSREELARMDASRRESALMICWANALCDHELSGAETEALEGFADALGVSETRVAELKRDAQIYLLERVLEEAFQDFAISIDEEDRIVQLGRTLGLTLDQTEDAVNAFRQRRGLV